MMPRTRYYCCCYPGSTNSNNHKQGNTTKLRLIARQNTTTTTTTTKNDASSPLYGALLTASKLEQWLTRRLALECPNEEDDDEAEDVVSFDIRYDAHWLKCQPLQRVPLLTILGIYEDEGSLELPVQTSFLMGVEEEEEEMEEEHGQDEESNGGGTSVEPSCGCDCRPLHSEWKRRPRLASSTSARGTPRKEESSSPSPFHLQWIDFRSIQQDLDFLSTSEGAWHCLTSLLGNRHWQNPWVDDHDDEKSSTPDMIALILPCMCSKLRDFRVSDACPAWFFHGYAYLGENLEQGDNNSASTGGGAVLYMYKRLKPRVRLSRTHPLLGGDSTATMVPPTGCLWETVPPKDDDDDDDDDDHENGTNANNEQSKETTYRLVSPPYLNLEEEYGSKIAQGLFNSQALEIFRREALQIPQWTPWPETQHYSVGKNGEITWSVFPLCYCFPAKDVSKRTWVEQTLPFCPQTCRLLESVLGDTLRTALFSRLQPDTVLEAHTGWADLANDVFRLHIPLVVPQSSSSSSPSALCGTWVDGCVETHQLGRPILFDDSKIHRAFNYHPTESRIVLIVDLARPGTCPRGTATGGHSDELDQFIAQMSLPK
jgi:hypothetical protein